jgi:AP-3 complex subunit beta
LLLDDKSAGVLGAATAAYTVVCPENFSIITPRFRGLCNTLSNVEEWGQVLLVDVLLRYVVAQNGYDKERAMFSTGS